MEECYEQINSTRRDGLALMQLLVQAFPMEELWCPTKGPEWKLQLARDEIRDRKKLVTPVYAFCEQQLDEHAKSILQHALGQQLQPLLQSLKDTAPAAAVVETMDDQ
jgi:hypothetical protein